jgi:hypothetical protein
MYFSPTLWQIAVSTDGQYIATLQIAKLTISINSSHIQEYRVIKVPIDLQKKPQHRQLVWHSSNVLYIYSPFLNNFYSYSLGNDTLTYHDFSLLSNNKYASDLSLCCISLIPINDSVKGVKSYNSLHMVLTNSIIKTIHINESGNIALLHEQDVNKLGSLVHYNRIFESVLWLEKSSSLVVCTVDINAKTNSTNVIVLSYLNKGWSIICDISMNRVKLPLNHMSNNRPESLVSWVCSMSQQLISGSKSQPLNQPILSMVSDPYNR